MPKSPFDNPLFRSATFTFKVPDGDWIVDERGNRVSAGRDIEVQFYIRASGGSARNTESGGAIATSNYTCYVIGVDGAPVKELPVAIKPGDVGHGSIDGRKCTAKVESLGQSSVRIVPQILGATVSLTITYQSREGGGA